MGPKAMEGNAIEQYFDVVVYYAVQCGCKFLR